MSKRDADYLWAGSPRAFTAMAMPKGDHRYGISGGAMVLVIEKRDGAVARRKYYSLEEARELRRELDHAITSLESAQVMAVCANKAAIMAAVNEIGGVICGAVDAPQPAQGAYPFRDHRSIAEIDESERA